MKPKKRKIKRKISVREFQRNFYKYAGEYPILVYNKRTGQPVFVVISPKDGGEMYETRTKGSVQPNN